MNVKKNEQLLNDIFDQINIFYNNNPNILLPPKIIQNSIYSFTKNDLLSETISPLYNNIKYKNTKNINPFNNLTVDQFLIEIQIIDSLSETEYEKESKFYRDNLSTNVYFESPLYYRKTHGLFKGYSIQELYRKKNKSTKQSDDETIAAYLSALGLSRCQKDDGTYINGNCSPAGNSGDSIRGSGGSNNINCNGSYDSGSGNCESNQLEENKCSYVQNLIGPIVGQCDSNRSFIGGNSQCQEDERGNPNLCHNTQCSQRSPQGNASCNHPSTFGCDNYQGNSSLDFNNCDKKYPSGGCDSSYFPGSGNWNIPCSQISKISDAYEAMMNVTISSIINLVQTADVSVRATNKIKVKAHDFFCNGDMSFDQSIDVKVITQQSINVEDTAELTLNFKNTILSSMDIMSDINEKASSCGVAARGDVPTFPPDVLDDFIQEAKTSIETNITVESMTLALEEVFSDIGLDNTVSLDFNGISVKGDCIINQTIQNENIFNQIMNVMVKKVLDIEQVNECSREFAMKREKKTEENQYDEGLINGGGGNGDGLWAKYKMYIIIGIIGMIGLFFIYKFINK